MLLPTHITKYSGPSTSQSQSSSTSYDYSGLDEINKRKDEANQLAIARQAQLYDGDVKGSLSSGQRIRSLLSSLKDIAPVRVASQSDSSDSRYDAADFEGVHGDPPPRMPAGGMSQATRQRNQRMANQLAGEPRRMDPNRGVVA